MKKNVLLVALLSLFFVGCADLDFSNTRYIKLVNTTDTTQTIKINNVAHSVEPYQESEFTTESPISIKFTSDNYYYEETIEDYHSNTPRHFTFKFSEYPKADYTFINDMTFDITIKDSENEDFSLVVPAGQTKSANLYIRAIKNFYIENEKTYHGLKYLEDNNKKYFFNFNQVDNIYTIDTEFVIE